MAEGRMLSKRVTRSGKVSSLSSDTARMIYSWLIPYTDAEGRMEADPRLLKADIAPLLEHITVAVINNVLLELHESGLIILYSSVGGVKRYLQITKFEENQKNLRKDREAASRIPGPPPAELRQNSGVMTDLLPPNIREVKLREAKVTPELERPVDNSKPEIENQKTALLEKQENQKPKTVIPQATENGNGSMEKFTADLQGVLSEIYQAYPDFKIHRQVQLFLELNLKSGHRGAIIHSLKSILKAGDGIITARTVGKYLSTTFTCEHAKYNARDHEREAEQWKQPLTPAARAIMEQLGLGGFGGGNG